MGQIIKVKCRSCSFEEMFMTGIGFSHPKVYARIVEEVKNGTFGLDWKRYMERNPGAVVNAGKDLYSCRKCGVLRTEYNLSLYRNLKGEPPVHGYWLLTEVPDPDYKYVKKYNHPCPSCSRTMKKINLKKDPVQCPKCGTIMVVENALSS